MLFINKFIFDNIEDNIRENSTDNLNGAVFSDIIMVK